MIELKDIINICKKLDDYFKNIYKKEGEKAILKLFTERKSELLEGKLL